jgi:hypothetical protein
VVVAVTIVMMITFDIGMNQNHVDQNGENRQVGDGPERENNLAEFTYEFIFDDKIIRTGE